MRPLRFVPFHQLDGRPNVIVDGSATAGTALTLSHWPGSPTPEDLLDDLSAQIAFRALDRPECLDGIELVSNNHFDQDGMASAFALIDPEGALERRAIAIDVARAGDFGTFESIEAARIAFALAAFEDPSPTPLDPALLDGPYDVVCGNLYEAILPRMPELLDHPDRFRSLWEREDAHLRESLDAMASGVIGIDERPEIDLAIVTVPDAWADRATTRFTVNRSDAVHPMAINQSTTRLRTLVRRGDDWRLEFRYETWVMFRSRPVMPRVDVRPLAQQLDALESRGGWTADPPGRLTPQLRSPEDGSRLPSATVVGTIAEFLAAAPAGWDPLDGR
ncbi:MAG: hypothetical protein JWM34_166 [Ilumatobacteraceae bacterium]|nr:hypothetical protein [Ilumatobacteraceae bacterium]